MNPSSQKKRIAILVPGGVGDIGSGMYIPALWSLVDHLAKHVDLVVYSLARPDWREPFGYCGGARITFLPVDHKGRTLRKTFLLINSCLKDHRINPFDAVHGFWAIPCGVAAVILGKNLQRPSIVTFMGGETGSLPGLGYGNMASFFTKRVTLWVSKRVNELVTLSQFQIEELQSAGYRRDDTHVYPFGVDNDRFSLREKDISVRPLKLLHVSNINPLKDQTTLLRAFQIISSSLDARLRIVGEDQSDGAIHRLAAQLGVSEKVTFVGTVPHNEMPREYEWAHLLVHTSMHEAGVLVAVEAAASGVPVAGTRTGLIADFAGKQALVCEIGDFRSLATSIIEMAHQPDRYSTMRLAAHAWAVEHDATWTVRQYLQLYEQSAIHYLPETK